MFRKVTFSALTAALFAVACSASASTVAFTGERTVGNNTNSNYVFGTATCSIGCLGILSDGSFSPTTSVALSLNNANPTTEANALNNLLGLTGNLAYTSSDATRENNGTSPFDFTGMFVALKFGSKTGYLFNSANVAQTVTFSGNPAGGLSHKTNFGELPSPVPLPAAAWMLLAALGGLYATRRRTV